MTNRKSDLLATRYGQRTQLTTRSKKFLATLGVAAITAVAIYFGLANYTGLEYREISFSVVDESSVELTFDLTKPKESIAVCSLQALNEQFGVVGYKEIEVSEQQTQTVRLSVSINTIELATTALVDDCRLK